MSAPTHPGFPLHRFNTAKTFIWASYPQMRSLLADKLSKRYVGGCGILDKFLQLIAIVEPRGKFRTLDPPYRRFEMWQVANAPVLPRCACRNYYDPEVQGAWQERDGKELHHPFCQFSQTSMRVFGDSQKSAEARQERGLNPQRRPDEWLQTRKELIKL